MGNSNLKHYSQLDGLRCFAILFVMVAHWIAWDTNNILIKNIPWSHGVILFFVLSGYLISNILFELKEKIDAGLTTRLQALKTFYYRRFLRIFPIYYLLIFYLFYINYENTREIFPWLVTYTSNILECKTGDYVGNFNHFWSLAVEEQFYIIWPFLILFVKQNKLMRLILGFMLISFISRLCCHLISNGNWMLASYFTPNLFLPLSLGALLAYSKRYKPSLSSFFDNTYFLYISAIFYSFAYYLFHVKLQVVIFDVLFDEYLFSFSCVFFISKASSNGFKWFGKWVLEHNLVTFTGKISYGLYVYHLFVIGFFWNYLSPKFKLHVDNKHAIWLIYFLVTYFLAILSFYIIEKPINKLKDRSTY